MDALNTQHVNSNSNTQSNVVSHFEDNNLLRYRHLESALI